MSSRLKWTFFSPHFGGSPSTWSLKKTICKQPPIGLPFHHLSDLYIKQSAPIGASEYDQMKVESLCTTKLQTLEIFRSRFAGISVESLKFNF